MTTIDQIESLGRIADDLELQHTLAPYAKTIRQTAAALERWVQTEKDYQSDYEALERHHKGTEEIIEDAQGLRPETGKALLHTLDSLKQQNKELREALDRVAASLWVAKTFTAFDSEAQKDYPFSESLAFKEGKDAYEKAKALSRAKVAGLGGSMPVCDHDDCSPRECKRAKAEVEQ